MSIMDSESCPMCKCTVNIASNRLVEELCGHKKCRQCLIKERLGCKLCHAEHMEQDKTETNLHKGEFQQKLDLISADNIKKYNGQLKLKTGWTILSKTSNNISPNTAEKEQRSKLKSADEEKLQQDKLGCDKISDISEKNESSLIVRVIQSRNYKKKAITLTSRKRIILPPHIKRMQSKEDQNIIYECSICQGRFKFKYHYRYHELCPTGDKPFRCEHCLKAFKTLSHLKYHLKTHIELSNYRCTYCGKNFTQIGQLNRHIKIHSRTKSFVCELCKKSFTTAKFLSTHKLRHEGEKPFKCQICQKKFNDSSNLRKHILSHNAHKQEYLCELCGKSFKLQWSLIAHKSAHLQTESHKCSKCDGMFIDQHSLRRHLTTHSDQKQYHCEYCKTKCRRKDNLARHVRNTHPENVINCNNNYSYNSEKLNRKKPIKKQIISDMAVTNIEKVETKLKMLNAEQNYMTDITQSETPLNSINVIRSTGKNLQNKEIMATRETCSNFRIPVINGPIKLSLKSMQHSVKQNLYINYDEKKCEDLHLDICRKILQAPLNKSINANSDTTNNDCKEKERSKELKNCNMNSTSNRKEQEYHIELYRKILMPSYVSECINQNQVLTSNKECRNSIIKDSNDEKDASFNLMETEKEHSQETKKSIMHSVTEKCDDHDNHVSTITMVLGNRIIQSSLNTVNSTNE